MNRRILGMLGLVTSAVLATSLAVVPGAHADAGTIVVWADETRGPHLTSVFAAKGDWVPGYTIKVVSFSSYDALDAAWNSTSGTTGPDILVAGNDWVVASAKSGKLAPVTLTAGQKSHFTSSQFYDLSYQGKLYGVPVDVNNVSMVYNTDLVKSAPKSFGDMVDFYKANKSADGLKAGLCIAGGGMAWGGLSVFSALGANPYEMFKGQYSGRPNYHYTFNPAVFASNVKTYLLDSNGKSNGFYPATDVGCKDNYLAGKVPFAVIGNWDWKDYTAKGFAMNLMPVPGVKAGTYGKMFGSVSGAFLSAYAAKHGVAVGAKSLLVNFFASTEGQVAYEALEGRPPAEKGAQSSPLVSDAQKGFGKAAGLAGLPQIGAFLSNNAGGANYWDSSGAYWTAVLVNGKNPLVEAKKLSKMWAKNVAAGKGDL